MGLVKRLIFKLFGWLPFVRTWELDDRLEAYLAEKRRPRQPFIDYPDELSPHHQGYDPRSGQHIRSKT